ncbi:LRP3_10_12 [Mytilus edulis]|uniref:LRP3_10_12 n=1 Tax=Mytilus edulis TaxID=6550 RepID=A0A8S3T7S2_MYTED|nr:LRP3_10_12 [Mytilus edulis]
MNTIVCFNVICQIIVQLYSHGVAAFGEYEGWETTHKSFLGDTQAVVCEGDSLLLSCDKHQFLSILSANFGREENDVCTIDRKINDTCKSPSALNIMQSLCEDNKACTVTASASVFGDDCPNVTRYLLFESTIQTIETAMGTYNVQPKLCTCDCNIRDIIHDIDLIRQVPVLNITKSIAVDKSALSSTRRRLTSAVDRRTSASMIGYGGVIILTLILTTILVFDIEGSIDIPFIRPAVYCHQWSIPIQPTTWESTSQEVVTVSFSQINIGQRSSDGTCGSNYLTIGGQAIGGRQLCGSQTPFVYISDMYDTKVLIKYYQNTSVADVGFTAKYTRGFMRMSSTCLKGENKCSNGKCIYDSWRCNNANECGDNSDEIGCPTKKTTQAPTTTATPINHNKRPVCDRSQILCRPIYNHQREECLDSHYKCDGKINCLGGEDENTNLCGKYLFQYVKYIKEYSNFIEEHCSALVLYTRVFIQDYFNKPIEPNSSVYYAQLDESTNGAQRDFVNGAPENSDAQGYSDTSGYTGAPRFNNPSGYSGARGSQPYRGGYRDNNRGYRGKKPGFQPRYNNPNFTPNTNYNKDIPIICRRYKTVKTPPKPKPRLKPMKSPPKPKSDIITDTSDLASESSSEDECYFVPDMTTDSAPTSTEDTVALQEVEIEQDTTESVGDAQSDIQEIRDDSELGSASGIDESSHELLNADETVQSDDSDALDDLVLTPIPPPRTGACPGYLKGGA